MMEWWKAMEKRIRRYFYGDSGADDTRAREAMHKFANEVQGLHAAVRQIQKSHDPWRELVIAIRGADEKSNNHEARH